MAASNYPGTTRNLQTGESGPATASKTANVQQIQSKKMSFNQTGVVARATAGEDPS